MSICLAAIKSIAVTSLGIHTGTYTTTTLLLNDPNFKKLANDTNVVNETYTRNIINKLNFWNKIWATLSTVTFTLCYFGAPYRFKHPYLIYSMVLIPLNQLLNWAMQKNFISSIKLTKDESEIKSGDTIAKPIELIDESIIDLGNDTEKDKDSDSDQDRPNPEAVPSIKSNHIATNETNNNNKYLWINSIVSTVILTQSIIGVYGEGYWG